MHLNHGPQIFSRKTDGPHMLSMHHEIVSGFDHPVALTSLLQTRDLCTSQYPRDPVLARHIHDICV